MTNTYRLDQLASKGNPTREEEKYAAVLLTLIEAMKKNITRSPMLPHWRSSHVDEANDLRQKDLAPILARKHRVRSLHKKRTSTKVT